MSEHEYVEYLLDVKDGKIVSAEYAGEGRQVEPLTKPIFLQPVDSIVWPRGLKRLERIMQRALRRFTS